MVKSPMLRKRKPNFVIGLIIIKVNIERLEKVIGKFLRNCFTLTIVLMAIATLKIGICNFRAMQNTCTTEGKRKILPA